MFKVLGISAPNLAALPGLSDETPPNGDA